MDIPVDIRQFNTWWDDPKALDQDISKWNFLGYMPDILSEIPNTTDGTALYVLRGMRLVGKTSLMKLMIKELLDDGVPPKNILYYESDQLSAALAVVDYHMADTTASGRRYLFLDGVASAPRWAKHMGSVLKSVPESTVVVSGYVDDVDGIDATSRVPDFRRISNPEDTNNATQDGFGHNVLMTPMSFYEAAIRMSPKINELAKNTDTFLPQNKLDIFNKLIHHEYDQRLEELADHTQSLNSVLDAYLATGGMPHAVAGYVRRGLSWDPLYAEHLDVLRKAWDVPRRNPDLFLRVGCWLANHDQNMISWDKLARGTGIVPPQLALSYAGLLERLFVLHILYRYKDGRPDTSAAKKIFFADPAYLHTFRYATDPMSPPAPLYVYEHRDHLLDGVVATHLMRLASLVLGDRYTDPRHSVFYWTDKKSRPVDFVLDLGGDVRVPVKVQTHHVSRRDMSALTLFLNQTKYGGLHLSRDELRVQRDYITIPASVFLMLI